MSAYCIHCNTENGHRPTCVMVWQGTPHDRLMAENSKLRAKIASLTAVLDAAREHINAHLALPETKRATEVDEDYAYDQGALWMAREILRILDAGRGGERE